MRVKSIIASAALPMIVFATGAQGQIAAPNAQSETYDNWSVRCVTAQGDGNAQVVKQACQMSLELRQGNTGQRVMFLGLAPNADDRNKFDATLIAPLGVELDKGITLIVEDKEFVDARFTTCVPEGCVARFGADGDVLKRLRTNDKVTVLMQASGSGQKIRLDTPLKGFSAAMDRLLVLAK